MFVSSSEYLFYLISSESCSRDKLLVILKHYNCYNYVPAACVNLYSNRCSPDIFIIKESYLVHYKHIPIHIQMHCVDWYHKPPPPKLNDRSLITSPPEGVARYCFHPVCLSVCVCLCVCLCVRPMFWYFIYRLLEEISI